MNSGRLRKKTIWGSIPNWVSRGWIQTLCFVCSSVWHCGNFNCLTHISHSVYIRWMVEQTSFDWATFSTLEMLDVDSQDWHLSVAFPFRYILPVILTTIATGMLVRFIQKRKQKRRMLSEVPCQIEAEVQGDKLDDLTFCLLAVAISFFLLVVPFAVLSVLLYTEYKACTLNQARAIIPNFALVNSCINFFIYYWKLLPFRRAINEVFFTKVNREIRQQVYSIETGQISVSSQWCSSEKSRHFSCSKLNTFLKFYGRQTPPTESCANFIPIVWWSWSHFKHSCLCPALRLTVV